MIRTKIDNHKIIPQLSDKAEYIYIEKARIEQDHASICIIQGNTTIPVPICQLSCIMLGPGTTVTHRAIEAIADSGCTVVWVGEDMRAYYATGFEKDRSSRNLLRQAECYADQQKHMAVVRKMYHVRFTDIPISGLEGLSLENMRGMEGLRMKELYEKYAEENCIEWEGRNYVRNDLDGQDDVNFFLTAGNQWLYHVCRAAIYSLGYSPAIGFIHTGKMDSFVYDMADLYKAQIVIPQAFHLAREIKENGLGRQGQLIRQACNEKAKEIKLLKQIVHDINTLFDIDEQDETEASGMLWDSKGDVPQGINYADVI